MNKKLFFSLLGIGSAYLFISGSFNKKKLKVKKRKDKKGKIKMSKTYRLFVSHSWTYNSDYEKVTNLLDSNGLQYYNHSVPKNDPIHSCGTDKELEAAIEAKMKNISCLLILAGVYSTYSKWINKEIEIAKKYNKPIIAIERWGAKKASSIVRENADIVVKWQGSSIINAIRKLA